MATTWTLAYRKPRANRFQRVTNWSGTWAQAMYLAGEFIAANPGLQVYYTVSAQSERPGDEDAGNILVDSGRRVRITETGTLSADLLVKVLSPEAAEARWNKIPAA